VIGDLPVAGIVVSAAGAATCRVTEFHDDGASIRLELAYLEARPISLLEKSGGDVFDGWWVAVTFDDGCAVRFGDPTFDDGGEDDFWGSEDATDDDAVSKPEERLRLREAETCTDGHQVVGSRLFDVVGPERVVSISSGWERIGLQAGTADVTTGASFQERITTTGARPPGWHTRMAYHPDRESKDEVDSYTMEWDWPSRLIRWVEAMPDRSLRAHVAGADGPGAQANSRLPTSDQVAAAAIPQRLPLLGATFERVWSLARTTGRAPDGHRPS
jgi:hypothetical protein